MVITSFCINEDLLKILRIRAHKQSRSVGFIIRKILNDALAETCTIGR